MKALKNNTKNHKGILTVIIFTICLLFGTQLQAQDNEEATGITISVVVDNISNDEGHAIFSLHSKDTFLRGQGIMMANSDIKEGKATVTFTNVPPGTYAILGMHDANDNKQMDFDANRMPTEAYGMSGNDLSFGHPQFINAKFEVNNTDLSFNIRF